MKIATMPQADYVAKYGPIGNAHTSEETLALFREIQQMPVNACKVLTPEKGDGQLHSLRGRTYQAMRKLMSKLKVNFELKFWVNRTAEHIVIVKVAKA